MRIVIATAVYYPMINGVAMFSYNLACGLAARGNEVLVICPSQTGRNYTRTINGVKVCYLKSTEVKIYPDQIHDVPEKKKIFGLKLPRVFYEHGFRVSVFPAREVKKILGKFCPDVVHVQVSDPIGLSVVSYARKHNIPVVTTEHNQPEVLTEPLKVPSVAKKPINAMLNAYFVNRQSKSDFVTMPTQAAIKNLIFARGKEFPVPVAAVSNGVDLSNFKPGKPDETVYKRYNISKDCPIVLYVGRVDPEKNVGAVLGAFALVHEKIPEAVLVIVGDGVDKARLEQKAEKIGIMESVRFLGRVMPPDLYDIYRAGTVFVTASEIETQGIVLIEAAASGLPLVAVDAGAVAEICVDNENGFLIPAERKKNKSMILGRRSINSERESTIPERGSINSKRGSMNSKLESMIAEAVSKILTDAKLEQRFSVNSVKFAQEHDIKNTLDKFMNIYHRVMINK